MSALDDMKKMQEIIDSWRERAEKAEARLAALRAENAELLAKVKLAGKAFRKIHNDPTLVDAQLRARLAAAEGIEAALLTVLDQVDYVRQNCSVTEMVGAVLPKEVIELARTKLAEYRKAGKE
jgi:hypothetical protein